MTQVRAFERKHELGEITMVYTEVVGTEVRGADTETAGPETVGIDPKGNQTFVMLHGIGMGRIVFAEVDEVLAGAGRVLAVDLPGFGDSPEPGSAATLEETAEVVADFIRDETPGPVILVGHSMSTQIAAEIACRHPELVRALVLIAPTVNRYERTAAK